MRQPEKVVAVFFLMAGATSLGGCYGQRFDVLERQLAETQEELRRLRAEEELCRERLASLEEKSTQQGETQSLTRAESASQYQQLLEGLEAIESALRERGQQADLLPGGPDAARWSPASLDSSQPPSADSTGAARSEAAREPGEAIPSEPAAGAGNGAAVRNAYEAARLDLTQGRYELAASAFQEFLHRFPTSELADNAQYWLGECYYAQKQYDRAYQEFDHVVTRYLHGDKVAAALLKMGYAQLALGNRAEGISLLKRVVAEHKRSPEAGSAQERLRELAGPAR